MLLTTKQLFEKCYGRYAIPAVNVFFMEEIHGLFAAAQEANAPFIVQTTPFARDYAHPEMLLSMINAAAKIYPNVTFAIHMDHGFEEHIFAAIEKGGYTSVMIDASHDDFDQNVSRTKEVVRRAHAENISVEAELGVLAGVEDDLTVDAAHSFYTNPQQVEDFVKATDCDSLAIAVGTRHGAYKFSGGQGLQFHILKEIQELLPGFPLVLHGGSNVIPEVVERINAAGGNLKTDAKGVQEEEIRKAIPLGVCKINIATDTRLLWTMVTREFFRDRPDEFAPTTPGKIFMEEYKKFMLKKFDLFGSTNKAGDFSLVNA
ncbi:class II fructose-bisphosphate aldolase [Dyadobacter sp. LJ53]|uniref:class II fructose-bisphosphate aldolase n=1 Tax=Dyadobacter chenwenxiniae TaxID=2906456 RepID=UPI001F385368|nr:class II fructose-bisphosphate aldolase [Dyadobacter chenwenxiniae]MCF0053534.1 class II fructose-bisphosphate aldolase [Dyadobacter chenwenxiniae]